MRARGAPSHLRGVISGFCLLLDGNNLTGFCSARRRGTEDAKVLPKPQLPSSAPPLPSWPSPSFSSPHIGASSSLLQIPPPRSGDAAMVSNRSIVSAPVLTGSISCPRCDRPFGLGSPVLEVSFGGRNLLSVLGVPGCQKFAPCKIVSYID